MNFINSNILSLVTIIICLVSFSCKNEKVPKSEFIGSGIPEVDKLSRLIEKSPDSDELLYQRAEAYYNNEVYDLCIEDAQRAVELDSSKWEYHHLMADAWLDKAESRKALRVLKDYLKINPNRIGTLLKLSEFQYILTQYDDALESINKIVQIQAQEPEAFYMLGRVFLEKGDTTKALNSFQTCVEFDSGHSDAWLALGNVLTVQNNPKALRYLDNGLMTSRDNIPLMQSKAFALQHFGNYLEALKIYDDIIGLDRQNAEAFFNKAVVYFKMDSLPASLKNYGIAQKLSPANYLFYLNQGFVFEKMGDLNSALEKYESAYKLGGDKDERVLSSIALVKSKLNE